MSDLFGVLQVVFKIIIVWFLSTFTFGFKDCFSLFRYLQRRFRQCSFKVQNTYWVGGTFKEGVFELYGVWTHRKGQGFKREKTDFYSNSVSDRFSVNTIFRFSLETKEGEGVEVSSLVHLSWRNRRETLGWSDEKH